jgi:hypothetical protein
MLEQKSVEAPKVGRYLSVEKKSGRFAPIIYAIRSLRVNIYVCPKESESRKTW